MSKKIKILLFFLLLCSFCTFVCAQNTYNFKYEVVKMDSTFDERADLTVETYMSHLKQEKDKKMDRVIGVSKEMLTSFSPQSPLSNLLVDMLFEWGNNDLLSKKMQPADLALLNFGGIRTALPKGNITIGDIYEIAPFDNLVTYIFVKGSELQKMFAGFTEIRNAPMANVQTTYKDGNLLSFSIGGMPLDHNKIYTLVTINFLATGGDGFLSNVNFESKLLTNTLLRDIYIDGIKKKTAQNIEIESKTDDRVKR